jgi:magnesium transporter
MYLRKSVYPLRELIGSLTNSKSSQFTDDIRIYLHDIYDHLIQIVDSIETYQDILSNMLDTYLSSISNKTNDTMKILTIFSTIFIPLTFLAGVYGMNFKVLPELGFGYGYPLFWVISIIIAAVMLMFFHKKKWF